MAETRQRYDQELRLRERIITALRLGNLGLLRQFASAMGNHDSPLSEWRAMRVAIPDIVVADPNGGEVVFYGLEDSNVAAIYGNVSPPEWTKEASVATVVDKDKASNKTAWQEDWKKRYLDLSRLLSKGSCEVRRQLLSIARYHQKLHLVREHFNRIGRDYALPGMEDLQFVLEAFDRTAMIVFQAASLGTAVSNSILPTRATSGTGIDSSQRCPETRRSQLESFLSGNEVKSSEDTPRFLSQTKEHAFADDALSGHPQVVSGTPLSSNFRKLGKRRRTHPLSVSESAHHRSMQNSYFPSNIQMSKCAKCANGEDGEDGNDAQRARKRPQKDGDEKADFNQQAVTSRTRSLSYTPHYSDELAQMLHPGVDEYTMIGSSPCRLVRKSPKRPCIRTNSLQYHHVPNSTGGGIPQPLSFSFSFPPPPASLESSTGSLRQGVRHLSLSSSSGASSAIASIVDENAMYSGSSEQGKAYAGYV